MKRIHKLLLSMLLTSLAFAISGCTTLREENPEDHQLPWATPANWEGTLPGMPR